jgi:Condensation domain
METLRQLREGPLSWAQQEWIMHLPEDTSSAFEDDLHIGWISDSPIPTADAVQAIRDVIARHEALRTTVHRPRGGSPWQRVEPADARLAEVVTVLGEDDFEAAAQRLRRTPFQVSTQWPIRAVVGERNGRTGRIAVAVDHLAVDGWSLGVLRGDLEEALRRRAAGLLPDLSTAMRHPLDDAEWEDSPAGRAHLARATAYWEKQLRKLGDELAGYPGPEPDLLVPRGPESFREAFLCSTRVVEAGARAASRFGVTVSALFLHAFGIAAAEAEGAPAAAVMAISANRFGEPARRTVSQRMMAAPVVVPATDGRGAAAAIVDSARQQALAHRFANMDPLLSDEMSARINPALHHTALCYARFNFTTAEMVEVDADPENWPYALPPTVRRPPLDTVVRGPRRGQGPKYFFHVHQWRDLTAIMLKWRDDTGWDEHAERILHRVDSLVREMAEVDGHAAWPPPPGG